MNNNQLITEIVKSRKSIEHKTQSDATGFFINKIEVTGGKSED